MTQSINGPNAHIQGFEAQWEQRFSFLPGILSGFGVNANYSHTISQVTFPSGFDGGRTDKPDLDRDSPNDYNFNLHLRQEPLFGALRDQPQRRRASPPINGTLRTAPANDPILG